MYQAGILEDVALDHRRNDYVVVALPDARSEDLVAVCDFGEALDQLGLAELALGQTGQREGLLAANRRGHRGIGQRVEVVEAEFGQHRRDVIVTGPDMAPCEGVRGFQEGGIDGQAGS